MIKLLFKLPRKLHVAVSGGVDSMALLDFLSANHQVTAVFFDHGTTASAEAKKFLTAEMARRGITLIQGKISTERQKWQSLEEHWRAERYDFFEKLGVKYLVTAHHLDDCVETWVFSCLHGTPKLIPLQRNFIYRPVLTTPKQELVSWAQRKGVAWIEDESNKDTSYARNFIRHELLPKAYQVNPGLRSTVEKKIIEVNNL